MKAPSYTLILCEKPDAARKVAAALAESRVSTMKIHGIEVLEFKRDGIDYVTCSAAGHLYKVSDSFPGRDSFPVFDLEWYPAGLVDKKASTTQRRIALIRSLAKNARQFVNACDYDVEGETIGGNIMRYACGEIERSALRARFSTLTSEDITASFHEAKVGAGQTLADAGRTRHALDFIWGINLSRVLSAAFNSSTSGYKTISIGRVQGPTLAFVVEREIEIRRFVPTPYWTVSGMFQKDGVDFKAPHARGKFSKRCDAEEAKNTCQGHQGVVSEMTKTVFKEAPPPPFNTGDLQREAYSAFGCSPSKTMRLAEELYLEALISYPRTSSQKLPQSIGFRRILSGLAKIPEYVVHAHDILSEPLLPREGGKSDKAHPAIYPTGELPRRLLPAQEKRIFDLIVRRFLSCFGGDAIRERTELGIDVNGNEFRVSSRVTLRPGWLKYYGKYENKPERNLPKLARGDLLTITRVECEEKLEQPPSRYNQGSLLERMEQEGIGTKATRAEMISTLSNRGYMAGDPILATELGISVFEVMAEYCPKMISVELTREIEKELDEVEDGKREGGEVISRAIRELCAEIEHLKSSEKGIGEELGQAATMATAQQSIGLCPVCKTGKLLVIRSRKTRKRFVGCSNYGNGCRASAPLPQKGWIKPTARPCLKCGWPVVCVGRRRYPWKLCVNVSCETKVRRRNAMQIV